MAAGFPDGPLGRGSRVRPQGDARYRSRRHIHLSALTRRPDIEIADHRFRISAVAVNRRDLIAVTRH